MNYSAILLTIKDRIAWVTINRPDKLNALNAQCKAELKDLFTNLRTNSEVDVIILTGAGEKAFVAGTDIGELIQLNAESGKDFS
ncbi:MAG TPA: enoyl-CoA hydratase-related protein, partial [Bacteroidota bacterium]|nr:enoyl-CoA hydratase-related protein [Bacteroidota bacterium]